MTPMELLQEELQETKEIKVIRPNWDDLVEKVIAIDLDVRYWRGETKLKKEDLGLEESDTEYQEFLQKQIRFGTKRLIPERFYNRLHQLESKARQFLNNNAQFSGWGHIMKKAFYPTWKQKMEEIRQEFLETGEQLATERDQIVEEMRGLYRTAALGAWEIKQKQDPNQPEKAPEEFVVRFVESILARIPTAQEIQASFDLDWTPSYIVPPRELMAERELERDYGVTEKDREKWEAFRKEQNLDREIRIKAQRKWTEQVENVLTESCVGVRELIHDTITDALASLKRNSYLHSRSLVSLRGLISRSRALNFVDDPDIEGRLVELESLVQTVTRDSDPTETQTILEGIRDETRTELLSLGRTLRGSREAETMIPIEENGTRKNRFSLDEEETIELSLNHFRRGKRERN